MKNEIYRWKEYHGLRPERRRRCDRAALETVSKAAELAKAAGEEVLAVVFGKDTDTKPVIAAGAAKVLTAGSNELQQKSRDPYKSLWKISAEGSLQAGTPEGKMIAPAVAAAFESGCETDVTGITAGGVSQHFPTTKCIKRHEDGREPSAYRDCPFRILRKRIWMRAGAERQMRM